ncbi:hypothetical protein LCGC14_2520410, partial [marine sediment metagenome]
MSYSDDKVNPIIDNDEELPVEDVDEALYGKEDVPDSGRMLAKPIAIQAIRSDLRQPRRVVPSEIRALVPDYWEDPEIMLNHWHQLAEQRHGKPISIHEGLMGYGVGEDDARTEDGLVRGFYDLMALAASIRADGLNNPITVVKHKIKEFIIETGERRWLAYHLLTTHSYSDFAKIPARIVDEIDLWRQAGENANRQDLIGIDLARQLALLIMDLRVGIGGQTYYDFDFFVKFGECDRAFYAQVANGNIHGIPRGQGQKILNATGIASMDSVRKYRALLSLSDEVWQMADDNNWTEGDIRREVKAAILAAIGKPTAAPIVEEDGANALIDEADDNVETTITWVNTDESNFQIDDRVKTPQGIGIILKRLSRSKGNDHRGLYIQLDGGSYPAMYHISDVEMMISQVAAPDAPAPAPVDDALVLIDGYPDLEELFKILA